MAGIGIQQGLIILVVLIMIRFPIDARRVGRDRPTSWRAQLYSLYLALVLISVSAPIYNALSFP